MDRIKLNLDDLRVESFDTLPESVVSTRATVKARGDTPLCLETYDYTICYPESICGGWGQTCDPACAGDYTCVGGGNTCPAGACLTQNDPTCHGWTCWTCYGGNTCQAPICWSF